MEDVMAAPTSGRHDGAVVTTRPEYARASEDGDTVMTGGGSEGV